MANLENYQQPQKAEHKTKPDRQVEQDERGEVRFVEEETAPTIKEDEILTEKEVGVEGIKTEEEVADEDILEVLEDPASVKSGAKIDAKIGALENELSGGERNAVDRLIKNLARREEDSPRPFSPEWEKVEEVWREKWRTALGQEEKLIQEGVKVMDRLGEESEQIWNKIPVVELGISEALTVREIDVVTAREPVKETKAPREAAKEVAAIEKEVRPGKKETYAEIGERRVKSTVEIGRKLSSKAVDRGKGTLSKLGGLLRSFGGVLGRLGYGGVGFVTEAPLDIGRGIAKGTKKGVEMGAAVVAEIAKEAADGKKAVEAWRAEMRKKAEREKRGKEMAGLRVEERRLGERRVFLEEEIRNLNRKLADTQGRLSEMRGQLA